MTQNSTVNALRSIVTDLDKYDYVSAGISIIS